MAIRKPNMLKCCSNWIETNVASVISVVQEDLKIDINQTKLVFKIRLIV